MALQTWFLVVIAVLFFFVNGMSWYRTWRLFGQLPWRLLKRMLAFTWHTPKAALLGLSIASLISCGVVFVVITPARGVVAVMFLIALSPLLIAARPPAVVFLTCSSPQSAAAFSAIRSAIAPLRCVALLDYRRLGALQFVECFNDNLRTRNERIWKSIVHQLIEIAPVVVVDARPETGPVADEAFLMLAPERAGRTLFLVGYKGECPALLAHGIDPTERALRTATEQTLAGNVRKLLNERQAIRHRDNAQSSVDLKIVPEDWDHLQSVLAIGLVDSFDTREIVRLLSDSRKDVIQLMTPLVNMDERVAQRMLELSWEFAYDSKLAMLVLNYGEVVFIRASFLIAQASKLEHHQVAMPRRELTWEELNKLHPVVEAVQAFVRDLSDQAKHQGVTCRYVETTMPRK